MSTPNPRSNGGQAQPLTAQQMNLRSTAPEQYPCFKESGFFEATNGCRMRCCIIPAMTPEGEDTPAWTARMLAEGEVGEPPRQLDFSNVKMTATPPKTVFTHNVESGLTPDGALGSSQTNLRVNMRHHGVPGLSAEDHVYPATPSSQKQ